MRRSTVAAAALVALVGAAAAVGATGALGLGGSSPNAASAGGGTPTDAADEADDPATPTDTPADEVEASLLADGDSLTLAADDGQVVRGETTLPEGSDVAVRLVSEDGASPFVVSQTATVGSDGTFAATFDLSDAEAGTTVTVQVRHDDAELVNTTTDLVAGDGTDDTGDETESEQPVTLDYEGETLTLANESGQVVGGTTDLEPGTEIVVRLQGDGSQPFILQQQVTVGENGTFEATFDLSDIAPTEHVEVTVRYDDETVAQAPANVTA